MKRHGDSQRLVSSESLTVRRAHASMPRLRSDGTVMTRYDDSQRSGRLAVTFGDLRVVDRVVASIASLPRLRFDGSVMKRPLTTHHSHSPLTTHHSPLTTHHSPLTTHHSPLTTHHSPLTTHHSPLTTHHSPASRPANRTAAECAAPVLTAAPSIGLVQTRHPSLSGTADHVGRNASARLTANRVGRKLRQSTEPALPPTPARAPSSPSVTAFPCGVTIAAPEAAHVLGRGLFKYYGPVRLPNSVHRRRSPWTSRHAPRRHPHVPLSTLHPRSCERRRMTRGRRGSLTLRSYDSFIHNTLPVFTGAQGVQNDTQRTLRARAVNPVSHTPRAFRNLTRTGRPRCGPESSQGAASRSAILSKSKQGY